MIIDTRMEFSAAQALTATAASTNVLDVRQNHRHIGRGRDLYLVVQVKVAADGTTGDEIYNVALQTDSVENFASPTTLVSFPIPAGAVAGTRFVHRIPDTNERYLRLNYTLGGTTPSVTVDAFITDQEVASFEALPDAEN